MHDNSCIGDYVDCYCVAPVTFHEFAVVSQYSYLCTASHDSRTSDLPLTTAPITLGRHSWVASDVFIGPEVTVGEGAVVSARSTVTKDVDEWMIVRGNPAVNVGQREFSQQN